MSQQVHVPVPQHLTDTQPIRQPSPFRVSVQVAKHFTLLFQIGVQGAFDVQIEVDVDVGEPGAVEVEVPFGQYVPQSQHEPVPIGQPCCHGERIARSVGVEVKVPVEIATGIRHAEHVDLAAAQSLPIQITIPQPMAQ